ncbi:biotin--[acetyl-CoA-carboxylase] ligase [Desertibaculum subflavum]|uniref:biotin--[acetyl-CoA-carboxylase] ligase n=1 Tax=Desertibaculum subflavum TaxID=2268458 RepID=UPI0034D21CB8
MIALPAGYQLAAYDTIGSTNDEALRLAEAGAPAGTVVWAKAQSGGRGRSGRGWASPPGNAYFSLLLRPAVPAAEAASLSFLAAVAVAEAFEALLAPGKAVACKWPNDVLIDARKAVGILLQSRLGTSGIVEALVVGIGTNVATRPEGTEWPATSLSAEGYAGGVEAVVAAEVAALDRWLGRWRAEGFAPVRAAWLARAHALGRRIRARTGSHELHGTFEGLDAAGALLLAGDDGKRHVITAGEVFPVG